MASDIHGGHQTIAGRVTRLSPPARYGIAVATTGFAALVRVAFRGLMGVTFVVIVEACVRSMATNSVVHRQ
jgi:hypothetical protein